MVRKLLPSYERFPSGCLIGRCGREIPRPHLDMSPLTELADRFAKGTAKDGG